MPRSRSQQPLRDHSPLAKPTSIAEGITAGPDGPVWAWVELPTRSTDDLNTEALIALTEDGSSELRRYLPRGREFCVKIQWGTHDGAAYAADEAARITTPTPGQADYLALGAKRITDNRFPRRQVLLGVHLPDRDTPALPAALRRGTRRAAGPDAEHADAALALRGAANAARLWHERMASSSFRARPATVEQLAWSLRRDLRRTVDWLPGGALAGAGQVARLVNGCRAVPHADHLVIDSDTGPRYLRILTCAQTGFPAADLELPGGEWLRQLAIAGDDLDAAPPAPVEVVLRGINLSAKDAVKRLGSALSLTKEQVREAANSSAEEPPEAIGVARATLPERIQEVTSGAVGMVVFHPRWIVEADSLHELERRTTAVIDHYGGMGIDLWVASQLQDILYKESVLGDHVRFDDCEQLAPMSTLVGGWFHGGSKVGSGVGPVLGGVVGSTPAPFRHRFTDAALEGRPVTTAFTGQTGGGKSTALLLGLAGELILNGAWGALTDFKGDLRGIIPMLDHYGVAVHEVTASEQASGSMDPFRWVPDPREAGSRAIDNLQAMLRPSQADAAEPLLQAAAEVVAARPADDQRSTAAIIDVLCRASEETTRAIGEELRTLAADPLALPLAGPIDWSAAALPTSPGLVYMRYDNLRMPSRTSPPASWRRGQRLSVALVQAGFAYLTYMGHRVRGIPKIVALTELHLITGFGFGKELVADTARLGRALDVSLMLDTQATLDLVSIEGLADQLAGVFCFRVNTDEEADAQARLLGQTPEPLIRARQTGYAPGVCCARVGRDVASVAFDYMSRDIAAWLNTTPTRDRAAA